MVSGRGIASRAAVRQSLTVAIALLALQPAAGILSDNGCKCATSRANAPGSNTTIPLGCRPLDGVKMCLVDVTASPGCGNNLTDIGVIDSCAAAQISNFAVLPSMKLEWDQGPTDFYTGQPISLVWEQTNIDEPVTLSLQLNGGSTFRNFATPNATSLRWDQNVSTSTGGSTWISTNSPLWIAAQSGPTLFNATANTTINVIQSRITITSVLDKNGNPVTSTPVNLPGEPFTISWRAWGMAARDTVTVAFYRRSSTTSYNTTLFPAAGNGTVTMVLPNSAAGNQLTLYVWVALPGTAGGFQNSFSATFGTTMNLVVPTASARATSTTSATATSSQTASGTATGTMTMTATPSPSPTRTSTPTPTSTSTGTGTPTPTPTGTPSPSQTPGQLEAAARRIAEQTKGDNTGTLIGAVVGTAVVVLLAMMTYQVYQRRMQTAERLKKLRENARAGMETGNNLYGLPKSDAGDSKVVVYQVSMPGGGMGGPGRSAYAPQAAGGMTAGRGPAGRGSSNRSVSASTARGSKV